MDEIQSEFLVMFEAGMKTLESIEHETILKAMKRFGNNRSKVAKALGISVRTLYSKLKLYELYEEESP